MRSRSQQVLVRRFIDRSRCAPIYSTGIAQQHLLPHPNLNSGTIPTNRSSYFSHNRQYCSSALGQQKYTTTMAKTVEEALRLGKLFSDDQKYAFLKLPISEVAVATTLVSVSKASSSSSFRGLLIDKDEITIMVPSQDYQEYMKDNSSDNKTIEVGEYVYRLITFDAVLDPTLIGFMATITKALAAAEISVLPFAAYSRDHIFVQDGDFEKAMKVLEGLAK